MLQPRHGGAQCHRGCVQLECDNKAKHCVVYLAFMSQPNRHVGAGRSKTDGDKAPAEKLNGHDNIMDFSFGTLFDKSLCYRITCVQTEHRGGHRK